MTLCAPASRKAAIDTQRGGCHSAMDLIANAVHTHSLSSVCLINDDGLTLKQIFDYATMWCASKSIAKALLNTNVIQQKLKVEGGARLGLMLEDGPLVPIVQLAVLRAGLTLIPLHPREPTQRLQHVLADANPTLLIVHVSDFGAIKETAATRGIEVMIDTDFWSLMEAAAEASLSGGQGSPCTADGLDSGRPGSTRVHFT